MSVEFRVSLWKSPRQVLNLVEGCCADPAHSPLEMECIREGNQAIFLHGKGSTRGVTIAVEKNRGIWSEFSLRINLFASEEDFRMAYMALETLARVGNAKVVREDSPDRLPHQALTAQEAHLVAQRESRSGIAFLEHLLSQEDPGSLVIPCWGFQISVKLQTYLEHRSLEVLMAELRDKFRRYVRANHCPLVMMKGQRTFCLWTFQATIMPKADLVGFEDPERKDPYSILRWEQFTEVHPLEDLEQDQSKNHWFYVPAHPDPGAFRESVKDKKFGFDDIKG